jgi:hypothetical protein
MRYGSRKSWSGFVEQGEHGLTEGMARDRESRWV